MPGRDSKDKENQGTADRDNIDNFSDLFQQGGRVIDDTTGKVLLGISTLNKEVASGLKVGGGNVIAATALGKVFAQKAKDKGVSKVCVDRGGYLYHGRVKAFADAARENGLEF